MKIVAIILDAIGLLRKPPRFVKPRFLHRAYALLRGYFWLPCPMCGKKFGGHEWRTVNASIPIMGSPGKGRGICQRCSEKHKEQISKRWDEAHLHWQKVTGLPR